MSLIIKTLISVFIAELVSKQTYAIYHLSPACTKKCSTYYKCNTNCEYYELQMCSRIIHATFVCNGCPDKVTCRLDKYFYKAVTANRDYKTILKDSIFKNPI